MFQPRTMFQSIAAIGAVILIAGCFRPQGSLIPYTGAAQTLISTETSPKTVRLMDVRTGEVIFESAIPVGKQFTYQFDSGAGDDPVDRPDLMRYEFLEIGKNHGKLSNALSVPNAVSRRVAFDVREGIEYAEAPPAMRLRADDAASRPDWWTERGGPIPNPDAAETMYDD